MARHPHPPDQRDGAASGNMEINATALGLVVAVRESLVREKEWVRGVIVLVRAR